MNIGKQIKEGLLTRNPVAVRLVGLCAAVAVTTTLLNGLGMGLCVTAVLILSNGILSALWFYLPERLRRISAIMVTAALGGAADLLVQAFFPTLAGELGFFLPLVPVTVILLSGAGSYAYENTVGRSLLEGLCQGLGYTLVLALVGFLRELLGKGTFGFGFLGGGQGLRLFPERYAALGLRGPAGGFLALGCVAALVRFWNGRLKGTQKKKKEKEGAGE